MAGTLKEKQKVIDEETEIWYLIPGSSWRRVYGPGLEGKCNNFENDGSKSTGPPGMVPTRG